MAPEFGHASAIAAGFCDSWGVGPFEITVGRRTFRFDDSDRFGPHLIGKGGDILAVAWPPGRSPFWRAHRIWRRQGRRVAEDGVTCVWDEPRPTKVYRVERQQFIVEAGDEDGATIEATAEEATAWRIRVAEARRQRASGTAKPRTPV